MFLKERWMDFSVTDQIKICLVNTYYGQGGAAVACSRLQEALHQSGTSAKLLNLFHENTDDEHFSFLSGVTGKLSAKYFFIKERLKLRPYQLDPVTAWNFSPACSGIDISKPKIVKQADVIHLHWINQGFLSLKSLQQLSSLNKPIVWTLHDMWMFTGGCHHSRGCNHFHDRCGYCPFLKNPNEQDLSARIHKQKEKIFPALNLNVVTPSRWLAEEAKKSSLLQQVPVSVIPNPLNLDLYKPFDQDTSRKKLGLDINANILLFMAANATSEYKGVKYLRESLNLLEQQHPEVAAKTILVVIGRTKDKSELNFPVKTIFTGTIHNESEIISYYNAADLFVLPSLEENLPNTIMEAMACGTPAVAFRTGGIPDLIDHLENGYLAEFKSAAELMKGIHLLLSDELLLKKLKVNARKKTETNYSYPVIAAKYKELYFQFAEKKLTT
jgi:glycosyltransferase involved in cell wall biosynthesis